jgi:tetratricopeptide (TPR) repeat protein
LPDPEVAIKRQLGEPAASKAVKRLRTAGVAFEAERFDDARRAIGPLVKDVPGVAEVRELAGLIAYRRGKWSEAVDHLEAFRHISGTTELHPVLADCHRALGHWGDVDLLWDELGGASPAPDIVTEGRIVTAGARADRGDLDGAIRLLEKGWKIPKKPREYHLRRAYALADLYDRAGRAPRARELFRWVEAQAPDLADVGARVRALG